MEQKAATNIGQDVPVLVRQLLSSNPRLKYKTAFRNLGIVQLVLGIVAVVLAIVNIILSTDSRGNFLAMIASGIWTGCMIIAVGCLGIATSKSTSDFPIISGIVLTIFVALASCAMMGVEITGAIVGAIPYRRNSTSASVIHSVLAIIGFAEITISVTHCVYCCTTICGPSRNEDEAMVLQVLPGQPIVQPMAHPLYITTASGRSDYPGISQQLQQQHLQEQQQQLQQQQQQHQQLQEQHQQLQKQEQQQQSQEQQQEQHLQEQEQHQQQQQQQHVNQTFQAGSVEPDDVPAHYDSIRNVLTETDAASSEKAISVASTQSNISKTLSHKDERNEK